MASTNPAGLHIQNLTAGYGITHHDSKNILHNISFTCAHGTLTGILGANGCGKTTLLKAVCGLLPHTGHCTLDATSLDGLSARKTATLCSYIPQRSGISIDISVLDVVCMGFNPKLGLLERPSAAMYAKAEEALRLVNLNTHLHDNFQTLSEGEKQLCILARTLVSDSRLLLLDEPESALDLQHRHQLLTLLRHRITQGSPSPKDCLGLITLHDPALALNYCDRLLVLDHGELLGTLEPRRDSLPQMESLLSKIYGSVTLTTCKDSHGRTHLVLLKTNI